MFEVGSDDAVRALADCGVVLNCAGPFSRTARPMVDACLRTGTHYLDITGEVGVFEALAARDHEAEAAGIVLLPGVGFDVVPTDCLAVHLKERLPSADRLTLAFRIEGGVSHGTLESMLENVGEAGLERRDGELVEVRAGGRRQIVDFGAGPVEALQVAWGDVSTAYRSTGIENIQVFAAASAAWRAVLAASGLLGGVLSTPLAQGTLRPMIGLLPKGPTERQRRRRRSWVWGRVGDSEGRTATSRLEGPEAYALTAVTAVAAADRILRGDHGAGFRTPALAFGPDFVLEVGGVSREDL